MSWWWLWWWCFNIYHLMDSSHHSYTHGCRFFNVTGKLVLSDDEQDGLASLAYAAGMMSYLSIHHHHLSRLSSMHSTHSSIFYLTYLFTYLLDFNSLHSDVLYDQSTYLSIHFCNSNRGEVHSPTSQCDRIRWSMLLCFLSHLCFYPSHLCFYSSHLYIYIYLSIDIDRFLRLYCWKYKYYTSSPQSESDWGSGYLR